MIEYLVNLSAWHAVQLAVALSAAIIFFLFAYFGGARLLYKAIVILIPFQLIDSKYGSLNMAVTYILTVATIFNPSWFEKTTKEKLPLIWIFILIMASFLMSWSIAPKAYFNKTLAYFVMLLSNIFLFYITYHYISKKDDIIEMFRLLFFSNFMVILYCFLTVVLIGKSTVLFGIEEFSLNQIDPKIMRIVGPFSAIGITAEYIVLQCILILYAILNSKYFNRYFLFVLFISNFIILIGTGNRGGMLSFMLSLVLFVYLYRKLIGSVKTILVLCSIIVVLSVSSFFMVKYSAYNVIFDRLMNTEMKGLTPDTRERDWLLTVKKIPEKPVIGHGPRIVLEKEYPSNAILPRGQLSFYPHNLYLFLLYTTGAIGLFVYSLLCIKYFYTLLKIKKRFSDKKYANDRFLIGLPLTGIIVLIVFLFDQMKIEFLRHNLLDYQHYLAVLFGMFYGIVKIEQPTDNVD